ncbi:MAG TPA: glycosyltransferase [Solirubrobacteraceae bacterium]|nr:glycosyltransferase [Solirubrobacteraceae bacterium]
MSDGPSEPERRSIAERIALTYRYAGGAELLRRAATFPLRYTPLADRVAHTPHAHTNPDEVIEPRQVQRWYRQHGRPVTVVIPTYGDPALVAEAVQSIRRTTKRSRVQIIVADDASSAEHLQALRGVRGVNRRILGTANRGFAANANRGLAAVDPSHDVVLLNSDIVARNPDWLAFLQHEAYSAPDIGIVGARLLYPDGRIQHAGVYRNIGAPQWFDHRYRFQSAHHGPANIECDVLAVTGACMYVRRAIINAIGLLDERYPMAYEDVDWCLRAWQAGHRVRYQPRAVLEHPESATRPTVVGEREQASQDHFWKRWRGFFEERPVITPDGRLRVIYVTEDSGVGGGHRDIFEHLNRLAARGHDVQLFTCAGPPDWFDLDVPVRSFADYGSLAVALSREPAIKVATWWRTAAAVWRASVEHGIPVFFVQDIETSYYPTSQPLRDGVLASYREEFAYMTISGYNAAGLRALGREPTVIPPGIDLENFRPLDDVQRREDMLLALGRMNPLKNLPLTLDAWKALPDGRPELCLFGVEPELGPLHGATYVERPSDSEVNRLFNEATVFVQTSTHEGFCLPALEAMAAGAPVVCTDAHGNRDFCFDGENCLIPEPTVESVSGAIARLFADAGLRERLAAAGRMTAADYAWERRIEALEAFYTSLAVAGTPGFPSAPDSTGQRSSAIRGASRLKTQ